MSTRRSALISIVCALLLVGAGCESAPVAPLAPSVTTATPAPAAVPTQAQPTNVAPPETPTPEVPAAVTPTVTSYKVTKVVDGDTIDVDVSGTTERIRIIGINTPETVDPRRPVECFGKEASAQAKKLLEGQTVRLEADATQDDRDKYGRLLRHVFLPQGEKDENFGLAMISDGYAYEYTYEIAYKYQAAYRAAQADAQKAKRGLWADDTCAGQKTAAAPSTQPVPVTPVPTPAPAPSTEKCVIKGNISSSHEKIYHVPGCGSYNATIIDETKGERWFCTEADAMAAGWRKAMNCP